MDNTFLSSLAGGLAGNSDKADLLVEKYHYWNSENRIERFYNNLIGYLDENAIATEPYEDGYITVSSILCQYDDLSNGYVYRLSKKFSPLNGLAYARMYELSQTLGTFRIEEPVVRKTVVVDGYEWEYTEFQAPARQNGNNVLSLQTQGTAVSEFGIEMLNIVTSALRAAKQVSQELGCGVPKSIGTMDSIYRDDAGFYISDMYDWLTPVSIALENGAVQFETAIYVMHRLGKIDDVAKEQLITQVRQQWQTI